MDEYAVRRKKLFVKMPNQSVAILFSGEEQFRNGDTAFPFRQKSDFYYLTGFSEPEAVLILSKDKNDQELFILFCQPNDPTAEIWTGPRIGIEEAISKYGANKAHPIQQLNEMVVKFFENKKNLFYTLGKNQKEDEQVIQWVTLGQKRKRNGIFVPDIWRDFLALIHELRLIKSKTEIALMRKAAIISANAHKAIMQNAKHLKTELAVESLFIQQCYELHVKNLAYPSIVGSGKNACILHYTQNNALLNQQELVLVDAGCEYENYASDITRTFPKNGRFTSDQKALYEIVLDAQMAAIQLIKPGLAWNAIQDIIIEIILDGLINLNILSGEKKLLKKQKAYQRFYMHSSGHWLGLDVHDVGAYKINGQWRQLEAGMVFTIEPGIYITTDLPDVDKRWWGIGIRIEDDIVVTENGCEILSNAAPKTVAEIEAIMN